MATYEPSRVMQQWLVDFLLQDDADNKSGQFVQVVETLQGPFADGSVVKEVTDGKTVIPAGFSGQAIQQWRSEAEENDECTESFDSAVLCLRKYSRVHLCHQQKTQCRFVLQVDDFTVLGQHFTTMKYVPLQPCMLVSDVQKKSEELWRQWLSTRSEKPDISDSESTQRTCMSSVDLSQLLDLLSQQESQQKPGQESQQDGQKKLAQDLQQDSEQDLLQDAQQDLKQESQEFETSEGSAIPGLIQDLTVEHLLIRKDEQEILDNIPEWRWDYVPPVTSIQSSSESQSSCLQPMMVNSSLPTSLLPSHSHPVEAEQDQLKTCLGTAGSDVQNKALMSELDCPKSAEKVEKRDDAEGTPVDVLKEDRKEEERLFQLSATKRDGVERQYGREQTSDVVQLLTCHEERSVNKVHLCLSGASADEEREQNLLAKLDIAAASSISQAGATETDQRPQPPLPKVVHSTQYDDAASQILLPDLELSPVVGSQQQQRRSMARRNLDKNAISADLDSSPLVVIARQEGDGREIRLTHQQNVHQPSLDLAHAPVEKDGVHHLERGSLPVSQEICTVGEVRCQDDEKTPQFQDSNVGRTVQTGLHTSKLPALLEKAINSPEEQRLFQLAEPSSAQKTSSIMAGKGESPETERLELLAKSPAAKETLTVDSPEAERLDILAKLPIPEEASKITSPETEQLLAKPPAVMNMDEGSNGDVANGSGDALSNLAQKMSGSSENQLFDSPDSVQGSGEGRKDDVRCEIIPQVGVVSVSPVKKSKQFEEPKPKAREHDEVQAYVCLKEDEPSCPEDRNLGDSVTVSEECLQTEEAREDQCKPRKKRVSRLKYVQEEAMTSDDAFQSPPEPRGLPTRKAKTAAKKMLPSRGAKANRKYVEAQDDTWDDSLVDSPRNESKDELDPEFEPDEPERPLKRGRQNVSSTEYESLSEIEDVKAPRRSRRLGRVTLGRQQVKPRESMVAKLDKTRNVIIAVTPKKEKSNASSVMFKSPAKKRFTRGSKKHSLFSEATLLLEPIPTEGRKKKAQKGLKPKTRKTESSELDQINDEAEYDRIMAEQAKETTESFKVLKLIEEPPQRRKATGIGDKNTVESDIVMVDEKSADVEVRIPRSTRNTPKGSNRNVEQSSPVIIESEGSGSINENPSKELFSPEIELKQLPSPQDMELETEAICEKSSKELFSGEHEIGSAQLVPVSSGEVIQESEPTELYCQIKIGTVEKPGNVEIKRTVMSCTEGLSIGVAGQRSVEGDHELDQSAHQNHEISQISPQLQSEMDQGAQRPVVLATESTSKMTPLDQSANPSEPGQSTPRHGPKTGQSTPIIVGQSIGTPTIAGIQELGQSMVTTELGQCAPMAEPKVGRSTPVVQDPSSETCLGKSTSERTSKAFRTDLQGTLDGPDSFSPQCSLPCYQEPSESRKTCSKRLSVGSTRSSVGDYQLTSQLLSKHGKSSEKTSSSMSKDFNGNDSRQEEPTEEGETQEDVEELCEGGVFTEPDEEMEIDEPTIVQSMQMLFSPEPILRTTPSVTFHSLCKYYQNAKFASDSMI